jgi:hypothetical protein
MSVTIEVSAGDLIDRITILEIKLERIADPGKRANVARELELLTRAWAGSAYAAADVAAARTQLRAVNERLWVIEDRLRDKEREQCFDAEFIELARSVYRGNDNRAALKRALNTRLGSTLVEEKSYAAYTSGDAAPAP